MVVITQNNPTLVTLVTPTLGVGSVTSVGCFSVSLSYYAREEPRPVTSITSTFALLNIDHSPNVFIALIKN